MVRGWRPWSTSAGSPAAGGSRSSGATRCTAWLADAGLGYEWYEELGGRRTPAPDSPNVALRNLQFRGYADHMATP